MDSQTVKQLAKEVGFAATGIARATALEEERGRYLAWLSEGRQGDMSWMTPERAERSADPSRVLSGARSVISVGVPYWSGPRSTHPDTGLVARYAWGADYHGVLGEMLSSLAGRLDEGCGGEHRWYVDTGPAMDKALAARSGIGWYGKNTNILTPRFGSFVVLGEILTTLDLDPDAPSTGTCGSCRLCLEACPTGALGPEYSIDSRKCISYLTIEHRGPIPLELRSAMGAWVFGCDICQDVCPPTMQSVLGKNERGPWARAVRQIVQEGRVGRAGSTTHAFGQAEPAGKSPLAKQPPNASLDLLWLLSLSHDEYLEAFRGTAIRRAKVWMLRRNAAIALGNVGGELHVPALVAALRQDSHPIVRGHSAWALGRLAAREGLTGVARELHCALETESEAVVVDEIHAAVATLETAGLGA